MRRLLTEGIENPVKYSAVRAAAFFILLFYVKVSQVLILVHWDLNRLLASGKALRVFFPVFLYQDFLFCALFFLVVCLWVRVLGGRKFFASLTVYLAMFVLSVYALANIDFYTALRDVFDFTYYSGNMLRSSFVRSNISSALEVLNPFVALVRLFSASLFLLYFPGLLDKFAVRVRRVDLWLRLVVSFFLIYLIVLSSAFSYSYYDRYPDLFEFTGDFTVFEKNLYFTLADSYILVFHGKPDKYLNPDLSLLRFDDENYVYTDPARPLVKVKRIVEETDNKPELNVVVIILESFRTDSLQVFGMPLNNTPNMVKLAENAVLFDNFYVNSPLSAKSLPTIMCSVHPYPNYKKIVLMNPGLRLLCLPEILKTFNYSTAFFSGFYMDYFREIDFLEKRQLDYFYTAHNISTEKYVKTTSWGFDEFALIEPSFEWIKKQEGNPFLAYYYTQSTHHPFRVPDDNYVFGSQDLGSRYYSAIYHTDKFIGELVRNLEANNLMNNTVIILVADHGILLTEWDEKTGFEVYYLYQENIHIPLIIINKKDIHEKQVNHKLGSLVDLVPTILDILNINIENPHQGQNLLEENENPVYLVSSHGKYIGIIKDDIKIVVNTKTRDVEVYNITVRDEIIPETSHPENTDELVNKAITWSITQNQLLEREIIW